MSVNSSDIGPDSHAHSPAPVVVHTTRNTMPVAMVDHRNWVGNAIAPPGAGTESDGIRYLKALRRRWAMVLGLGTLLAAVAATGAWFLMSPKYTAFSLVQVAAAPPRIVGLSAGANDNRTDFNTFLRTQAGRIRSRLVLMAALKRPEVQQFNLADREAVPVAWLEDELKVEYKEGSELITISMTSRDPDEAIALVNAVTQSYLQEIVSVETRQRGEQISEVQELYDNSKEELRQKRNLLKRLADQQGTSDKEALTQKQLMTLGELGDLKRQYNQVRWDLMKVQGRMNSVKSRAASQVVQPVPDDIVDQRLKNDELGKGYLDRILKLKEIIRDYELHARRPDEISLITAKKQVASLEKDLAARRQALMEELEQHFNRNTREDYEGNLAQLQDEAAYLASQEKELAARVQQANQEASKIGNSSTEIYMLRYDIQQEEKKNQQLADRLDALRFELRSPARVSLYQEAGLQRRDNRRQVLAATAAPIGAFLFVGLCVSWWEMRSRRVQTVNEVTSGLGLRLFGAVPELPAAALRRRLIVGADEHKVYGPTFLESIDAIRMMLLRDANRDGTRIIMVTSAVEGEGKTTLASHLASSLARAGRKTLLIDCDLRRPVLQDLFELPLQPGFSEVLLGEIDALAAVQQSANGLYVLTAGQWDREVLRALAKEGAQPIIEQLKNHFDFIIIDSHPVLAATDSLLVGQHAEAVLFSLLRDRSQIHLVYAACERLASLGIRVLGAVVNGIDHDSLFDEFSQSLPRYPRT